MRDYSENKGYLQIELADEKIWLHFGMNAIKILQDEFNLTLTELGHQMNSEDAFERFESISKLIYVGKKAYDVQHGLDVDYTSAMLFEDVLTMGDVTIKRFTESVAYMNGVDYVMKNVGKKKLDRSQQTEKTSTS